MKKALLTVIIAVCAGLMLAGCGAEKKASDSSETMELALILDPVSAVDEQYNEQLQAAVKNACAQYGNRLSAENIMIPSGVDRKAYIDEQLRNKKFDIVIDSDLYYARSVIDLAEKYPRTKFVIVDEDVAVVGKNSNLLLINYNAFQEGLIAGYSAGVKAKNSVAIIALKNNPNSVNLLKGYRVGIALANKALNIRVINIDVKQYDVNTAFTNEQQLRNAVFNAVRQAVGEGADVILPESVLPIAPVISAVQNSSTMIAATEVEYRNLIHDKNYLSCITENYESGVAQAITMAMTHELSGGVLDMNIFNAGLKFVSPDKVNSAACDKLIGELKSDPGKIAKLEGK